MPLCGYSISRCGDNCLVTFTKVSYTSLIIAHEQMKAFAYISLLEAVLKLGVAFLIAFSPMDKLVFMPF